jgi:hypothetical protein
MKDHKLLAQRIKDLEASVAYFAPGNKQESERFVAKSFVENLHISFKKDEIISPEDDPPDVIFRDANFEVKEILDPGRRRHDEYKKELQRAKSVNKSSDLIKTFAPKDITLAEIYARCEQNANALELKYPSAVKARLDLLFYVNLIEVMYVTELPYPDTSIIGTLGWRSISFIMGQRSCCFYASPSAPLFIQQAVGHVTHLYPV